MNVIVKTLSGQTARITNVSQNDCVKELKTKILHSNINYPVSIQKLEYRGETLDDNMRLCDYNYVSGDIIDVRMILNSQVMLNHEESKQQQHISKHGKTHKNGKKSSNHNIYSYTNLTNNNTNDSVGCCGFM